jgi:hypothetical protein
MLENYQNLIDPDLSHTQWFEKHKLKVDPQLGVPVIDNNILLYAMYERTKYANYSIPTRYQHAQFTKYIFKNLKPAPYCNNAEGKEENVGWKGYAQGKNDMLVWKETLPVREVPRPSGSFQGPVKLVCAQNAVYFKGAGEKTGLTVVSNKPYITSPVVIAVAKVNDPIETLWIYDLNRYKDQSTEKTPGFVWQIRKAELEKNILNLLLKRVPN